MRSDWCISILIIILTSRFWSLIGLDCRHPRFGNFDSAVSIDVTLMKSYVVAFFNPTGVPGSLASHADILLARHAIFPPQRTFDWEERLSDEPKECLRGRLQEAGAMVNKLNLVPKRNVSCFDSVFSVEPLKPCSTCI